MIETEIQSDTRIKQPKLKRRFARVLLGLFGLLLVIVFAGYTYVHSLNEPPPDFPLHTEIHIAAGDSVRIIAEKLEAQHVVRSADLLYYIIAKNGSATNVKASTYIFDTPLTADAIAHRLTQGDFDTNLIRLTHIEGERATLLAARAADVLPNFDKVRFIASAELYEGKLFPDTYFVPVEYTDEDLLELLLATFAEKIAPLQSQIEAHSLTLEEILTLASIIEREANTTESMQLVSSVLQNRINIGMALQADASIEYVLDKPLDELTASDLEIPSLYNTYLNPGLPPTPIGNPGLDAILAVLEPAESNYFYYITDSDGKFHYAETYNEHLRNIEKYLR